MELQENYMSPEPLPPEPEQAPTHHEDHEEAAATHAADQNSGHDGGQHHDQAAKGLKGTAHTTVSLGLGTQYGPDGKPTGAPAEKKEAKIADAAKVTLHAGKGNEIELGVGAAPTEDELFERGASGHAVKNRSGSVAAPNVSPTMVPDNLYIGGAPHVEDIHQGGLGDCFFQSCLIGLSQNDPGKLQSVMTYSGGSAGITFQRLDAKTGTYKHVTMHENSGLLTRTDKHGHLSLVGSGLRIGDAPKRVQWWAEIHGSTVEIHRRDMYETALWAPLMEKAYADFAQHHGSDGTGAAAADKKKSGYAVIDAGGSVEHCYQLFYGAAATAGTTNMQFTPGTDVVGANIPAIQDLLRYQAQKGNTAPGTTQTFMHARMSDSGAVTRGRDLIDQVSGLLSFEQTIDDVSASLWGETAMEEIERLLRTIDRGLLRSSLATLRTTLVGNLATPATATAADVAKAANPVSTPDLFPHLWNDTMPAPFRHLRENLGILINLGDDASPGRRMNYTSHAYEVRDVVLADKSGAALAVNAGNVATHAADIDATKSLIVMHNPHGTNEPDLKGTGPTDGKDDGIFTYSLDQFLRNFDLLRMATVGH